MNLTFYSETIQIVSYYDFNTKKNSIEMHNLSN
jgi:hypothetical protein